MIGKAAALTALVAAALGIAAPLPAGAATALPAANTEAVLKAAQIDPRRADSTQKPGAHDSVLPVEQALRDKGLLDAQWVDGYFGTTTIAAYSQYQKSLGCTGIDTSGLPGRTSPAKLGTGHHTVTAVLTPGSHVTYHGVTLNTRTKAMPVAAEGLLGRQLSLTQGSYNPGGVDASAGTHDGGGAFEISVAGMSAETHTSVAKALHQVGFAAWIRTSEQAEWDYHIHAIAISGPDLPSGAQHQAGDYYLGLNGLNGLAGRGPDDGPAVNPKVTWEEYQRG
ncbi:peptidoglycan-binding protein [Amycolatopsis sp. FDAARGOS 1241]|uniref:peptidoglycan-binding protein n=1 Tax=Amycolatopsis sp. FDAARGOS 1241 TaxID=2778070 RepID=UPI00194E42CC|nr:peptidoglycan-binding protein [Amycolatopsis sp. FDAARGOS 1241]QRP43300.1 peptidoglycan-binding protein [Amycolatopsis sp. FDAARGOS 1241]